jgi:hypothetical protein
MGDEDPGGGVFDCRLDVLCEPSASSEPAKVRSTTQRRGKILKPFTVSDRLMISRFHAPILLSARWSFGPA